MAKCYSTDSKHDPRCMFHDRGDKCVALSSSFEERADMAKYRNILKHIRWPGMAVNVIEPFSVNKGEACAFDKRVTDMSIDELQRLCTWLIYKDLKVKNPGCINDGPDQVSGHFSSVWK